MYAWLYDVYDERVGKPYLVQHSGIHGYYAVPENETET